MEQYSKNGNLELGWMYTLLPDPPMLHKNKEKPIVSMPVQPTAKRRAGRKAFASLVENEVMHTALAALKNYAAAGGSSSGGAAAPGSHEP